MVSKEFITAGRAVFTLEIPLDFQKKHLSKPHYTYRVKHKPATRDWPEAWFVQLLTGQDNTTSFTYIGLLNPQTGVIRFTAKSPETLIDSIPIKLLGRALINIWKGTPERITENGFEIHHEGRCGRCSKILTVPSSILSGFGPECVKRI